MNPYDRLNHHLDEWTAYQKGQPRKTDPLLDGQDFLAGYLSSLGFHPYHTPVHDAEAGITRLPFLDEYWTRPGIIHVSDDDLAYQDIRVLQRQVASCLKEAHRRDELHRLVNLPKVSNLRAIYERGA